MRHPIGLMLLTLLILVGGCIRSLNPVLKDEQVVADNNVVGSWISTDKDRMSLEIIVCGDKQYHVTLREKDGKTGWFVMRLGQVGDLRIAEFAPTDHDEVADIYRAQLLPLHSFFWVQQTSPTLQARTMNPDWLKDYLQEHPTELAVAGEKSDQRIITATTDELQKFILAHYKDEKAFGETIEFVRPAATQPATQPAR